MGDLGRPFRGSEALAAGLVTRRGLARDHRPVFVGVYLRRDVALTPLLKAEAAWLWSGRRGVVAGLSAAVVHGSKWIDVAEPAELVHANHRAPTGLIVRRDRIESDERADHGLVPVTTVPRTVLDLARTRGRDDAVRRIDALLNAQARPDRVHAAAEITIAAVRELAVRHRGIRGMAGVPGVLDLVDAGAESPPETDTRLCLVRAGLPRPRTQFPILTEYGPTATARLDMAYPRAKVAVEYDGGDHWLDRRTRTNDIDRHTALEDLGWKVIRVDSELLARRIPEIVDRVRRALAARGGLDGPIRPAPAR